MADKYTDMEGTNPQQPLKLFTGWVLLTQILGLALVILMAVWMGHYRGGFAWQSDPGKQFNYHPLFMTIGLLFLYGNAILVYRVFRNDRKMYIKILHAVLHLFVLIFTGVGLKAVFDSHNLPDPPIPNLYSLHSWLGILTVGCFALQWFAGFGTFLWPGLNTSLRSSYKPAHVFWGIALFILAGATALTGITEKAIFSVKGYNSHVSEGFLLNTIGLIIVGLIAVIVYVVTNPAFERRPLPEEEHLELTR